MHERTPLRVNWYPATLPRTRLEVYGALSNTDPELGEWSTVRTYRVGDEWLAVAVDDGERPEVFKVLTLEPGDNLEHDAPSDAFEPLAEDDHPSNPDTLTYKLGGLIPTVISTLLQRALRNYFQASGMKVVPGVGEDAAYCRRYVDTLPNFLSFYEGLRVKVFHVRRDSERHWGVVMDYSTHQEFAHTLADDDIQQSLATSRFPVTCEDDANNRSWTLSEVKNGIATLRRGTLTLKSKLPQIRLKASYPAIREYSRVRGSGDIVRLLQIESLSLTQEGYANVRRLSDQYKRVEILLKRTTAGNINLELPTACRSIASIATDPAVVEVRS